MIILDWHVTPRCLPLQEGARDHGVGAGASHLISGHFSLHQQLEQTLAAFTGKPAAILFSSGYLANLGAVQALVGRNDRFLRQTESRVTQ